MKQKMILLHGLFGGLSNWTEVIGHFENEFEVYVPQLPLYEPHTGDSLNFLVDRIHTLVDTKAVLIGNSLGGHIAIHIAHRYPQLVDKLVLTGSSGLYENMQAGSYLRRRNYAYLKERIAATFYDPVLATDELVKEVMQITSDSDKCRSIIKVAKSTQRDKVTYLLPDIKTPTLLIWGEQDQITPPEVAKQFRDSLPNAQLVMFDQCGHAPMMEKPMEFNKALAHFLC